MVAIVFNVFSLGDLPYSFIGACLGAIISAIITQVLLLGQTKNEEVKETNVKVFKQKSKIFKKYIFELWNILGKQELTIDEFVELRKNYTAQLMIYLKEKSNRAIVESLKNIGEYVYNDAPYENLKKHIFDIINILSEELNLGGKLDLSLDNELEDTIFPELFKQAILNELNKSMRNNGLYKGKYCLEEELINDGQWGGEYICFDFRGYNGCKIIIGSFSEYCPHAGIWMFLFVDKNIHEIDRFRYNDEKEYRFCEFSRYLIEIFYTMDDGDIDWVKLNARQLDDEEYNKLGEFEEPAEGSWMFLDDISSIEQYRNNYREVAQVMGKRAAYWFKHGVIIDKKNKTPYKITDFLQKFIGNRKDVE